MVHSVDDSYSRNVYQLSLYIMQIKMDQLCQPRPEMNCVPLFDAHLSSHFGMLLPLVACFFVFLITFCHLFRLQITTVTIASLICTFFKELYESYPHLRFMFLCIFIVFSFEMGKQIKVNLTLTKSDTNEKSGEFWFCSYVRFRFVLII